MQLDLQADRSLFLQIAEKIEDSILQKALEEEEQAPSTNQLAALYRINPATAAKGVSILVDEGILYKRRGIGMFVASGAVEKIRQKRHDTFSGRFIQPMLAEAARLGIEVPELYEMIAARQKEHRETAG